LDILRTMPDFSASQYVILAVLALLFIFPARGIQWLLRRDHEPSASEPPAANAVTPAGRSVLSAPPAPRSRFCTECGTRVGANGRFCTECGTPIARSPST
jgi:hypothetical protein